MNNRDNQVLAALRSRLPDDIKANVKALLVYGSRVRGTATADSDLDVAALVETKSPELEKCLEDVAYDVMWDFDFNPIVSIKVFNYARFHNAAEMGFSYYRNVLTQGRPV